jgi:arsenate reductase
MAAAWMQHLAGDTIEVLSGGSDPAEAVNSAAVEAMAEVGIDISRSSPRKWTDDDVASADVAVTMGCGDTCPVFAGVRYLDWNVDDPAGWTVENIRPVRDDIKSRVETLIGDLGVEPIEPT